MLIKKDSIGKALITGTKAQDEFNYFQDQLSKPLTDRMTKLEKAYDVGKQKKNKKAMTVWIKHLMPLICEQKQLVIDFAKSHPASIVSAFEIYSNFSYNSRLGQLDSVYHLLDTGSTRHPILENRFKIQLKKPN